MSNVVVRAAQGYRIKAARRRITQDFRGKIIVRGPGQNASRSFCAVGEIYAAT